MQKLQIRAFTKINFKKIHHLIKHIYKHHKILKFTVNLKIQHWNFMYQVKQNNALATSFSVLHSRENQNYQGRSTTQSLLHLPLTVINKYGKESVKYQCLRDWNNFKKKFLEIPEKELSNMKIKRILKQLFLINTERFIHHHQLPYVQPYYFYFLSSRIVQMTP